MRNNSQTYTDTCKTANIERQLHFQGQVISCNINTNYLTLISAVL